MSLQVWLPLNGNLNNQGLSTQTANITSTPVWATTGKIGGKSLYTNVRQTTMYFPGLVGVSTYSVAYWLYIPTAIEPTAWSDMFGIAFNCAGTTYWERDERRAATTTGRHNYHLAKSTAEGSNTNAHYGTREDDSANDNWVHYVLVKDSTSARLYADGVLVVTVPVANFESTTRTMTGSVYLGDSGCEAYLQDFRIYDHCLSPMEVKELSKGLVLHYPLNRGGWGQENLFTENYWSYGSGWNVKNLINSSTSTIKPIVNADGSCTLTGGDASNSQCYCSNNGYKVNLEPNTTYTISVKITTNGPCNFRIWWYDYDSDGTKLTTYSTPSTTIESGVTKVFSVTRTTVANTASCYWELNLYGTPSTSTCIMHAKSLKLEKGSIATPWCPNSSDTLAITMGLNGTTEYDCSGYCNNGSKMTDTITYNSDTAKYAVSTHFNGTYDGIIIENLALKDMINSAITYAFWIKPENESGARSIYFGSYSGISWSVEKTAGNQLRLYWNGSPDETCSGTIITDGVWQHICITKNGTNDVKVYINGIQKWTSTATHSNLNFPTIYRIGRDTRSNDGTPYKGLMSDFRIYATALSADDVKSLYHNNAYIDSNGNVYGAVHSEV